MEKGAVKARKKRQSHDGIDKAGDGIELFLKIRKYKS